VFLFSAITVNEGWLAASHALSVLAIVDMQSLYFWICVLCEQFCYEKKKKKGGMIDLSQKK